MKKVSVLVYSGNCFLPTGQIKRKYFRKLMFSLNFHSLVAQNLCVNISVPLSSASHFCQCCHITCDPLMGILYFRSNEFEWTTVRNTSPWAEQIFAQSCFVPPSFTVQCHTAVAVVTEMWWWLGGTFSGVKPPAWQKLVTTAKLQAGAPEHQSLLFSSLIYCPQCSFLSPHLCFWLTKNDSTFLFRIQKQGKIGFGTPQYRIQKVAQNLK